MAVSGNSAQANGLGMMTTVRSTTAELSGNAPSLSPTTGTLSGIVDRSGVLQLAAAANGQAQGLVLKVSLAKGNTTKTRYGRGNGKSLYCIASANAAGPDTLTVENGRSGVTVISFPQSSDRVYIPSGASEKSDVDRTAELATMIEAQKSCTANSKVSQTGSGLIDVLATLVR